jgi:hypothetical protein
MQQKKFMESWQKLYFLSNKSWLRLQNESISLQPLYYIVGMAIKILGY